MDGRLRKLADDTGSFSLFHQSNLQKTYIGEDRGGSGKPPKPSLRCVVCGDSSSGKHYGVLACNGCSGFFKRSVRKKLIYRCQAASGDCIVDKAHRNQCQACRLKKCLECGMNKDAVQNERQPRNSATVRPEFSFSSAAKPYLKVSDSTSIPDITVGVFSPFFTLPSKIFPQSSFGLYPDLKDETTTSEFTTLKTNVLYKETPVQLQDLPTIRSSIDAKSSLPVDPAKESIYETSSRILLMTIRWTRNLPSYSSLCFDDQIILLEETWSELFLLSALQWGLPLDTNFLLSSLESTLPKASNEHRKHLHLLQRTSSRLKILATDLAEFACLKAIILFKADAEHLKDNYQVEMLQDHAQLMLATHIKSQHVESTFRFGRLLLILPTLRQISSEIVECLFFGNMGSTFMAKLLRDMLKS